MSIELKAGPTSLERLEAAVARMVQKHGFLEIAPNFPVDRNGADSSPGLAALLLTEDPQRNLEVLDACVILPEALKPLGERIARQVAGHAASAPLMQRYSVPRAPAVVFLREGEFVGVLNGIRDWGEYQAEVARLLDGSAQPAFARKAIAIPVRAVNQPGACA